jgi:hypothetical protein
MSAFGGKADMRRTLATLEAGKDQATAVLEACRCAITLPLPHFLQRKRLTN